MKLSYNFYTNFRCFMITDLDMLICGNFILYKIDQDKKLKEDYKNKFKLD